MNLIIRKNRKICYRLDLENMRIRFTGFSLKFDRTKEEKKELIKILMDYLINDISNNFSEDPFTTLYKRRKYIGYSEIEMLLHELLEV